jgi:putative redox protein
MPKHKLSFKGTNNNTLIAEFDTPDNVEQRFIALYAPCFTCTKNLRAIKYISKMLNKKGISLFRFDFPGLGESEGDFSQSNFSTNLENIKHAYNYLKDNYEAPKLLIGHSLGGAAMLKMTMELPEVVATAVIAAPDTPSHLIGKLKRNKEEAEIHGVSKRNIGGEVFSLTKGFFDNLILNSEDFDLSKITKPLLVMHSPDDDTIDLDYSLKIFNQVSGHKSFITLNNVGHLMMKPKDAEYVGKLISTWIGTYLD